MMDYLEKQLIRHEGLRLRPYHDSVGKLTIGAGHNIDDLGITESQAMLILKDDIAQVMKDLSDHLSWWTSLDEARRVVMMNMCFNLGITKLLGFRNTLLAIQNGDYEQAAKHMEDSQWHKQVKGRAIELEQIMRTGE